MKAAAQIGGKWQRGSAHLMDAAWAVDNGLEAQFFEGQVVVVSVGHGHEGSRHDARKREGFGDSQSRAVFGSVWAVIVIFAISLSLPFWARSKPQKGVGQPQPGPWIAIRTESARTVLRGHQTARIHPGLDLPGHHILIDPPGPKMNRIC